MSLLLAACNEEVHGWLLSSSGGIGCCGGMSRREGYDSMK